MRPAKLVSNLNEFTYPEANSNFSPIDEVSLDLYVDYINAMHHKNNQGFKKEYIVS